jgi:hypothetical protein
MSEIWIGLSSGGVIIARAGEGALLVDRPAQRRYREPIVHSGGAVDGVVLRPMPPLPADLADRTGWYAGGGRRLLLTQIPEAYFGEPMILVEEGGAIGRAYPFDDGTLVTDDGELLHLTEDGGVESAHGALTRWSPSTSRPATRSCPRR